MVTYKWNMEQLKDVKKINRSVFSCFSCAGGSSLGYKLAGYDVIGNCEIDEKTNKIYQKNNMPKYSFCMDIREFINQDIFPDELYNLDILDGSPPCTTFSVAGDREKTWGKMKKFAEGNKLQRLDDLFFSFISLAEKLQPKIVVAENVEGIIKGNAKGYVREIIIAFNKAGYDVQIFKLNSATMGVPQKRVRVFFIAKRKDLNFPELKLSFNENPILFGEVRSEKGKEPSEFLSNLLLKRKRTDLRLADINLRIRNKEIGFTDSIVWDDEVCNTVCAGGNMIRGADGKLFSDMDFITVSSFPQDFYFGERGPKFYCGMSVPPLMMMKIAEQINKQLLSKEKRGKIK